MKLFNILFAFIFLWFAALQYNDPDPYVWIPIYGSMAAFCVAVLFRIPKFIYFALAIIFVAYAAVLLPSVMGWLKSEDPSQLFDEFAKMQNLYIEETREFLGLMICLTVLVVNYIWKQRQTP